MGPVGAPGRENGGQFGFNNRRLWICWVPLAGFFVVAFLPESMQHFLVVVAGSQWSVSFLRGFGLEQQRISWRAYMTEV